MSKITNLNILIYQNSHYPTDLWKGITSLMLSHPVAIMTNLSKPRPNPPWGIVPNFLKSK